MTDTGGKYSPITRASNLHAGTDRTMRFANTDAAGLAVNAGGYSMEWILYDAAGAAVLTVPNASISTAALAATTDEILVPWTATGVAWANESVSPGKHYTYKLYRTDVPSVLAFGPVEIL